MEVLLENAQSLLQGDGWKLIVMWVIGAVLIYLAIAKDMEPSLLLPIGFGAILMNLPGADLEILHLLYEKGIANELFPLILFIGIGAMIDFGPLLSNPKLMIFGAAAQFGIFFTFFVASLCGFDIRDSPPSPSSARRTAQHPLSWQTPCRAATSARSPSLPIPIWRWSPSSSRPSSAC